MSDAPISLSARDETPSSRPAGSYVLRILGVTAASDYKLKYSGSVLGYVWSIAKPLALFTALYFVFGHIFKLTKIDHYYGQSLLIGLVCFYFFADATSLAIYSLVMKESLLRKLVFPRVVIPISTVLTAGITFLVNLVVVGIFVASAGIAPRLDWLLLVPLILELFIFVTAVSIILATLFVRLRDVAQVWELVVQLFMYASAIAYPIGYLPSWGQKIVFLNPFVQIMQDARSLLLYPDLPQNRITVVTDYGPWGRLIPLGITLALVVIAALFFRREEPSLAERV